MAYRSFNFQTTKWEHIDIDFQKESFDYSKYWIEPHSQNSVVMIDTHKNQIYEIPSQDYKSARMDKYLIRTLKEELPKEKSILEKKASFILVPSYKCNMNCPYCYQQNDKTLSKIKISEDNYNAFSEFVKNNVHKYNTFDVQLFGGEALLHENEDLVLKTLDLARELKTQISITTNGLSIPHYLKTLILHRKHIDVIGTTIDGNMASHLIRRNAIDTKASHYEDIIQALLILLDVGVHVRISMNVDSQNIGEIQGLIDQLKVIGFFKFQNFFFEISRVDDRLYETNYPHIIPEVDLIHALNNLNLEGAHVNAAFQKTGHELLRSIGLSFNQEEEKSSKEYCWAKNPNTDVFYVDSNLDVFRCTYTVGRGQYKIGNLNTEIDASSWFEKNNWEKDNCLNCPISGYCNGGCRLSTRVNPDKFCENEKEAFGRLVREVVIPQIYQYGG